MLKLENVYCGYQPQVDIVKDVTMQVHPGEMCCIIGPNGAGKTTLLKSLAHILPYRGEIRINDRSVDAMKRKEIGRTVAILSQAGSMYFPYSVFDTVMLGRYSYSKGAFASADLQDVEAVNQALRTVGLFELKDRLISELSGGQLQRVFLARAIAQDPEIILLDEPTNHLDFKYQIEVLDHVKRWARDENKMVVAVLHDLNLVQKYADKVILMHEGELFSSGHTKEVLTNSSLQEIYGINVKEWMLGVLELWQ